MPGRRFWILAASLSLTVAAMAAEPAQTVAKLAEVMPPRHRSWVLVLVGGTGLVGGYLAASGAAYVLEPVYGWRALWLQGFPSGLLLLALARFIPETPRFLAERGRLAELEQIQHRFGLVPKPRPQPAAHPAGGRRPARACVSNRWPCLGLHMRATPNEVARGWRAAVSKQVSRQKLSTLRVSRGSITPSSSTRPLV